MKKYSLTLLQIFITSNFLFAQYSIPEEIINGSALIQSQNGSGSGFFIQDSVDIFFVTARHVLLTGQSNSQTKKIEYKPNHPIIEVRWYARKAESSDANLMIIDLNFLIANGNLIYGVKPEDDFVIMRIANYEVKESYGSVNYSAAITRPGPSSSLIPCPIEIAGKFNEINIGDDVIMVGYPKSLGLKEIPQYDFNRPLIRKGIIAGKDTKFKNIILDCPSFGGNSGGAVFEIVGNAFQNEYKLAGIVSAFIPLEEVWINPNYGIKNIEVANSGYSVIIPIDKAIERIKEIKQREFK